MNSQHILDLAAEQAAADRREEAYQQDRDYTIGTQVKNEDVPVHDEYKSKPIKSETESAIRYGFRPSTINRESQNLNEAVLAREQNKFISIERETEPAILYKSRRSAINRDSQNLNEDVLARGETEFRTPKSETESPDPPIARRTKSAGIQPRRNRPASTLPRRSISTGSQVRRN
ncbi:MAG: hypothetical protein Q9169_003813 [Polycauliona sp. 2 TL-2023]